MAKQILRWSNVEKAVREYLIAGLSVPVFTRTGASPPPSYVLIERTGGAFTAIDKAFDIEVVVVAPSREAMWDLVADVESLMHGLPTQAAGGVYVDEVSEAFGFAFDQSGNPNERRAEALYTLTVRPNVVATP